MQPRRSVQQYAFAAVTVDRLSQMAALLQAPCNDRMAYCISMTCVHHLLDQHAGLAHGRDKDCRQHARRVTVALLCSGVSVFILWLMLLADCHHSRCCV
jgi:hypothetical protein